MRHTLDEMKVMEEYEASVDEEVLFFVNNQCDEAKQDVTVGFLTAKAAEKIKELTGKEVYGNRIILDKNGLKHIVDRHGVCGKQDNSMSDNRDIARIGYVLANYDDIEFRNEYAKSH